MPKSTDRVINMFAEKFNLPAEAIMLLIKIGVLPENLSKFDNFELLKRIRAVWNNKVFLRVSLSKLGENKRRALLVCNKDNLPEWELYVRSICEQMYSQEASSAEIAQGMREIISEVNTMFNISQTVDIKQRVHTIRKTVAKKYYRQRRSQDEI